MQKLAFAQLFCCLVLVLDVGDTKADSSAEAGTDASEKQQLLVIIKELEEEIAAMAKNSAKEREQTAKEREQMTKRTEELLEEIRRERENKDSKTVKKLQRQLKELQGQNQEYKSWMAKRLKDAVNPKSDNGSLHKNSSRMDAGESSQGPPATSGAFCRSSGVLQKFTIGKTWPEARLYCQGKGGDLATFPITEELVRAQKQAGTGENMWIGGHCDGGTSVCSRTNEKKPWKWIGGNIDISYELKYWSGYTGGSGGEPFGFDGNPACLSMNGKPERKQMLVAYGCNVQGNFLCQLPMPA